MSKIYWDKLRVLVTNGCNYRCPFCHNEGQTKSQGIEFMDINDFEDLIDMLKDEPVSELTFSGGEPFLNKHLVDMIQYVSHKTTWEISCASNLSLIQQKDIDALRGIDLKFNIQFPFASAAKFNKSTGIGNLSDIESKIASVTDAGLKIGLNSVIQSSDIEDVKKMIIYAVDHELPLKLLPQLGLAGSDQFRNIVYPVLDSIAIDRHDKGSGSVKWTVKYNGHTTTVQYIDSPCFTRDIETCRRYSEIRIHPDMTLQPCIQNENKLTKLELDKGAEFVKEQFSREWKNLKHCL